MFFSCIFKTIKTLFKQTIKKRNTYTLTNERCFPKIGVKSFFEKHHGAVATAYWIYINNVMKVSVNVPNGNWNRNNRKLNVNSNNPGNRNENCGCPSAVRDYAVLRDLSQPPSILPISASLLWDWKILVSLAIFNSKNKRSFKVAISAKLPALIK